MKPYKVVIVDDHEIFRNGLSFIINNNSDYKVVAHFENGIDLEEFLEENIPDLIIMDLKMPKKDGHRTSLEVLSMYPDIKILIMTLYGENDKFTSLLNVGIKGFVLKNASTDELYKAMDAVVKGRVFFSQELLLNVIQRNETSLMSKLTLRELDILDYLCQGLTSSEIAEKIHISQRTVENHRRNLMIKTGCDNSIKLVLYAIKNKLVDTENISTS